MRMPLPSSYGGDLCRFRLRVGEGVLPPPSRRTAGWSSSCFRHEAIFEKIVLLPVLSGQLPCLREALKMCNECFQGSLLELLTVSPKGNLPFPMKARTSL